MTNNMDRSALMPARRCLRTASLWLAGVLAIAACITAARPVFATQSRFDVATQLDFLGKQGFTLDFENNSPGDDPCPLNSLKLSLGVTDGNNWRFTPVVLDWKYGHEYKIDMTITSTDTTLKIDGKQVADSPGGYLPHVGPILAADVPSYSNGPTEYLVYQKNLLVTAKGLPAAKIDFSGTYNSPVEQYFITRNTPALYENWVDTTGAPLHLSATVKFLKFPDVTKIAPVIDAYGQPRYASWPTKIRKDSDLSAVIPGEKKRLKSFGHASELDSYGGTTNLGWKEDGTGYFRTLKRNGYWWLIDPSGYPSFYTCVANVSAYSDEGTPTTGRENLYAWLPPKTGKYARCWPPSHWGSDDTAAYFSFGDANLIRKYGDNWEQDAWASNVDRLHSWGFGGMGKWCEHHEGLTDLPVLSADDVPKLVDHIDPFDTAIAGQLHDSLAKQMQPRLTDPYLLGWSFGNEVEEIIHKAEIATILSKDGAVPAKRALVDYGVDTLYGGDVAKTAAAWGVTAQTRDDLYASTPKPSDDDMEQLRRDYADHYYALLYQTVKSIDPNHLYFGGWLFPYWGWENEYDWVLEGKNADVVGFDFYQYDYNDPNLIRWMKETDKPVFCGEWALPPADRGVRGLGTYGVWTTDEADAGRWYTKWMDQAARSPYTVGMTWFEYRDEPVTGRGPGNGDGLVYGEDYAFGLVDDTDQVKWDLVTPIRKANLAAAPTRFKLTVP